MTTKGPIVSVQRMRRAFYDAESVYYRRLKSETFP
jgi:hypothetical protein